MPWQTTVFKEFVTLQRGFDLPKSRRSDGPFPVVVAAGVDGSHAEYKVKAPGVTTGRSGSLGQVVYVQRPFWPLNTTLWVKDFKGNLPRYVYYHLKLMDLAQFNSGAGVPTLNRNHLDTLEVHIPPLPTQKKIAAILSAYDDLIENNERRIRILEDMAQNLYREWFVKFRFPGHKKVKMVDSPLGKIPKGWEMKRLDELVDFNPTLPLEKNTDIPYVAMVGLSTNSMIVRITEHREKSGGSRFQNGDTLFARITPCLENGKTGFVQCLPADETVALGSTEFIVMRSKRPSPSFVYLLARSDSFRDTAIKSMSGATGRQRVQIESVRQYEIPEPDGTTLAVFSDAVDSMFGRVYVLSRRCEALRQTRDLLLPKLIAGDVDVSELDIAIPENTETG